MNSEVAQPQDNAISPNAGLTQDQLDQINIVREKARELREAMNVAGEYGLGFRVESYSSFNPKDVEEYGCIILHAVTVDAKLLA